MKFQKLNTNAVLSFKTIRSAVLGLALLLLSVAVYFAPGASASDPGSGDWPMWGGTPDRNMISNMKGLPIS